MLKRLLVLSAATAAAALLPAAGASATTFDGRCIVNGQAFFQPGLAFSFFDENAYRFAAEPRISSCDGTLDGQPFSGPVRATITGEANMACQGAGGLGGRAAIDFDPALAAGDPAKRVLRAGFEFIGPVASYEYRLVGASSGMAGGSLLMKPAATWVDRCRTSGVLVRAADFGTAFAGTLSG